MTTFKLLFTSYIPLKHRKLMFFEVFSGYGAGSFRLKWVKNIFCSKFLVNLFCKKFLNINICIVDIN